MEKIKISFTVDSTDYSAPLLLEVFVGDQEIYHDHIKELTPVQAEVELESGEWNLSFVMSNKQTAHTLVDVDGNIIKDARLKISDIKFDDIPLGQTFIDHSVYHHDFNGTQTAVQDKFYGEMGCNGRLILNFSTPIYVWLLEHM